MGFFDHSIDRLPIRRLLYCFVLSFRLTKLVSLLCEQIL